MRTTARSLLSAALFWVGCAGASQGQGPAEPGDDGGTPPATSESPAPDPRPTGPRYLDHEATFADLIAVANDLDDRGLAESSVDCMLRPPSRDGWPWQLQADLAVATRPLPGAEEDLDGRLDGSPSPVLAITRWSQLGSRSFELALAVFTNTPPPTGHEGAIVLALTNRGVYLRRTDQLISAGRTAATPLSGLADLLRTNVEEGQMIVVTAEAEVPLSELRRLLSALPEGAPVALAAALGESIRVPDPPPPPSDRQSGLCPEGLPELAQGEARGQLEPALIVGALGPLREAVVGCMESTAGARAPGGRVELMMRIGEDGRVGESCLASDEIGGAQLRDCLIRAAQATAFPRPRPAGSVDVALPLMLRPTYQAPICDESDSARR